MQRWLRQNGMCNVRTPGTKHTHTLMSGGVVSVPDEEYDTFLRLYANEVRAGNKTLTFSECRSDPLFRMYFDVDLLDENVLDDSFSIKMTTVIQDVIKTYYPISTDEDTFKCILCTTKTKDVEKDGVKYVKNGYHIIYPSLNVTVEQAFQLRYNVVYKMEGEFGERKLASNTWSDAIDMAPYNNGLKMCGSFKKVKCTICKKKNPSDVEEMKSLMKKIIAERKKVHPRDYEYDYKSVDDLSDSERRDTVICEAVFKYKLLVAYNTCTQCMNGSYIEDRTYMPKHVLSGDGTTDVYHLQSLNRDMYETMKQTSIRFRPDQTITNGFKKPDGVPIYPDSSTCANIRHIGNMSRFNPAFQNEIMNNDIFLTDAKAMLIWDGPEVTDENVKMAIQDIVRYGFSREFRELTVKSIVEKTYVSNEKKKGTKLTNSLIESAGLSIPTGVVTSNTVYYVRVVGKGSQFCMNKGTDHTSNSIYFMITESQCFHKCFSKNDYTRDGQRISCEKYRSHGKNLPHSIKKILFPDDISALGISEKSPGKRKTPEEEEKEAAKRRKLSEMLLS